MKRPIRTLKDLDTELLILEEKKKLQEAYIKSTFSQFRENLKPSSILQQLLPGMFNFFSHGNKAGFGESIKSAAMRRVFRFFVNLKNKFTGK